MVWLAYTAEPTRPILDPTQVKALLSAASGDRLEAPYVLAIHTALRRSEILGLTGGMLTWTPAPYRCNDLRGYQGHL